MLGQQPRRQERQRDDERRHAEPAQATACTRGATVLLPDTHPAKRADACDRILRGRYDTTAGQDDDTGTLRGKEAASRQEVPGYTTVSPTVAATQATTTASGMSPSLSPRQPSPGATC